MEIIWLLFCGAVAYWANERGRCPVLWGLLALVISPLLAGVALAMMQDKKQNDQVVKNQMETQQLKDRVSVNEVEMNEKINRVEERVQTLETTGDVPVKIQQSTNPVLLDEATKLCPECGERIKQGAIKCRYCGADLKEVKMVECPFCKELIRSDAVKCKYCRSDIPKEEVVENTGVDK